MYAAMGERSQRAKLRDRGKLETSFSPVDAAWESGGHVSRDMPADLYSASILSLMNSKGKSDLLRICLPMFILMCMGTFIQIYLLDRILLAIVDPVKKSSGSHANQCLRSNVPLRNICMLTYVTVCFRHVKETVKMYFWLSVFRWEWGTMKHQPLRLVREELHDPEGGLSISAVRPVSHISAPEGLVYVLILLAKISVELFATFVGSGGVLLSASDLDLILNTLAATFILELDDVLHDVFVPKMWNAFCTAPELTAVVRGSVLNLQLFFPYLAALLIGFIAGGVGGAWCGFTDDGSRFRELILLSFARDPYSPPAAPPPMMPPPM